MTFVSYAQNFEDVMLWRALRDVEAGYYVDVGAQDPKTHSVTRAFYDRGWRGINIEPVKEWFDQLESQRPDDTNLRIAVASEPGRHIFYEVPGTGLSTFDRETAERHQRERGFVFVETSIEVRTLTEVIQQVGLTDIHFLKVDVEGAERSVLEGLDLELIRPWIIVVEATMPLTETDNSSDWDGILLRSRYQFVHFDGLNRFYVAVERGALVAQFDRPQNVFDDFVPIALVDCQEELGKAREALAAAESRAAHAEAIVQDIYHSLSWKLAWPLRVLERVYRAWMHHE